MDRMAAVVLALASSAPAFCQQVAFTARGSSFDCPVAISSFVESKAYGFESVVLENDGDLPVAAVYLRVTFQTEAGSEIVEERRVADRNLAFGRGLEINVVDADAVVADHLQARQSIE